MLFYEPNMYQLTESPTSLNSFIPTDVKFVPSVEFLRCKGALDLGVSNFHILEAKATRYQLECTKQI